MSDPAMPDPCLCGHDLGDHDLGADAPCGVHGCRCDVFEADGDGFDPERDGRHVAYDAADAFAELFSAARQDGLL